MYFGHPVIGAVHVIQAEMLSAPAGEMTVAMPSGPMSIRLDHGDGPIPVITMRQEVPSFATQ